MKEVKIFLLAFALLFVGSCTKSDGVEKDTNGNNNNNGGGGTNTPSYYFTCKVNGVLIQVISSNFI
jgi:hypothetical protein